MADVDPALGQEILDVAQRQRVLHVHQHRQTDYLGRAVEIAERVAHGLKLPQPKTTRKIGLTMPAARRSPRFSPVFVTVAHSKGHLRLDRVLYTFFQVPT